MSNIPEVRLAGTRWNEPTLALSPTAQQQATLLANRLRTLLDVAAAQRGHELTFGEISDGMARRGISLSRGRWFYMLGAERAVNDLKLLDGLSSYFGVDPGYLRGEDVIPDAVAAELELLRTMRTAKVKSYAARMLGELSPETLGAITKVLDAETGARTPEETTD